MAQNVALKANSADANYLLFDRRGRTLEDPGVAKGAVTAVFELSTMDGLVEIASRTVSVTCLIESGTPTPGSGEATALPASTLVGAGKVFASAQEAVAWRAKLLEIYQALRAHKGWE